MPTRSERAVALLFVVTACGPGLRTVASDERAPGAQAGLEVTLVAEAGGGGRALVVERRVVTLSAGDGELVLDGVPAGSGVVTVRLLDAPAGAALGAVVQELGGLEPAALLAAALGVEVVIVVAGETLRGRLVGVDERYLAIEVGAGEAARVRLVARGPAMAGLQVPGVSQSLVRVRTRGGAGGSALVELLFEIPGVTWAADHQLLLDGAGGASLSSHATLINRSVRALRGAQVTLLAAGEAPLESRRFVVAGQVDLPPGGQVRVPLAAPVPVSPRPLLRFAATGGSVEMRAKELEASYGAQATAALVRAELRFVAPGPGPAGRVLVYRAGPDGAPVLWAEGRMEHTAAGGEATVIVGPGHALSGARRQIAVDWGANVMIETFEISVRNEGPEPVVVRIWEPMYRAPAWRIVKHTHDPIQVAPREVEFEVRVAAGKRAHVRYTVEYPF